MIRTKKIEAGGIEITVAQPTLRATRDLDQSDTSDEAKASAAIREYIESARKRGGDDGGASLDDVSFGELMEAYAVLRKWHYGVDDTAGKAPSP
jgi:hypothetical protein